MGTRFRRFFVTGLIAIIPLAVTLFLLSWIFNKLDKLSPLLTQALIALGVPLPPGFRIPGLGIIFTAALLLLVGALVTTFIGRTIVNWGETLLEKIPFVRTIYGGVKQVVVAVTSQKSAFRQVVMVEYPRKGIFSLGFVTCEGSGEVQEADQRHMVYVFIPTTPNPTSGLLILVPQDELIPLSMTVEEGIKLVMSGGLLSPEPTLALQAKSSQDPSKEESQAS